jgi:hypothetical protein
MRQGNSFGPPRFSLIRDKVKVSSMEVLKGIGWDLKI